MPEIADLENRVLGLYLQPWTSVPQHLLPPYTSEIAIPTVEQLKPPGSHLSGHHMATAATSQPSCQFAIYERFWILKFLYKIYSGFDEFYPSRIPERLHKGKRLVLWWKRYLSSV